MRRVRLSATLNRARAARVRTALAAHNPNVSSLAGFADTEPLPLRWGEIVPLAFLNATLRAGATVIVLSQPTRRYTEAAAMVPELQRLGRVLYREVEAWPERVAVVVSSDLAHTHLPTGPYGYSPAAEPFDAACARWAAGLNSTELSVVAAAYVDRAMSCGFTGLVLLDGLLQAAREAPGGAWNARMLAVAHPTYYGMMVAQMLPPHRTADGAGIGVQS